MSRLSNPLRPSEIPSATEDVKQQQAVRSWATEAIKEGESFVRSQPGFDKIDDIINAIMGESKDDLLRPLSISNLSINHTGKIALDMASGLTDIKPFWTYKTSNSRFEQQAIMGQKLASAWWVNRLIDLKFCDVNKYALAAGSGYAHLVWNTATQDQDLIAEDPRDVLPIRPSSLISIQDAFGVILRRERTVNYLRSKYPDKANYIQADREGSFAALSKNTRAGKLLEAFGMKSGFVQNLYASLGGKTAAQQLNVPVADSFTIYVKDEAVNQTGEDKIVGDPDANWSYLVHPGEALYPRGRCIEMTRSAVLYDGPNIYWHGLFPVPKLTLDPWPWTWLGKSPLKDVLSLQSELTRVARGVADKFEQAWRPGLTGDKNAVSKALMDRLDTRRAGIKIRTNPVAGQGVRYDHPDMTATNLAITQWLPFIIQAMREISGTQELTSMLQLNQLPATETIERMLEAMSPAIRLRSRVMEAFLREMAMMVLSNFFQFYTIAQRIAVLGPRQGITFEDFDFDPESLVPDMVAIMGKGDDGNPLPRYERAKTFLRYFTYHIAPGSLLSASEVTDKLLYIQLARMGYLDVITLLEKLGLPNVGAPEDAGQTIAERLAWQQQTGIGMQVGPAGASAAGRKASGGSMPRMVMKES